jgi:hypothetical protein
MGGEMRIGGRDRPRVGVKAKRGLRVRVTLKGCGRGNIANAICCGMMPLSLEHDGRILIFRCARSFGIIGGSAEIIFDSLTA